MVPTWWSGPLRRSVRLSLALSACRVAALGTALLAGLGTASVAHAGTGGYRGWGAVAARPAGPASDDTRPCDFATVSACQSTTPHIKTYLAFSGSTAGCTFDVTISWGDSRKTQTVVLTSPPDGTDFLAAHSYRYTDKVETFPIYLSATVTAGSCGFQPGQLTFTLVPCTSSELSGAHWSARFPDSRSVSTLAGAFRRGVFAFIATMRHARITVRVISTLRPPERAYLMHYSWLVAKRRLSPTKVPYFAGHGRRDPPVGICWVHVNGRGADRSASFAAARRLASALGVAAHRTAPLLASLRTTGLAIDMSTIWSRRVTIRDATGHAVIIRSAPRDGLNKVLISVGASYGVIHFQPASRASDDWSVNGH